VIVTLMVIMVVMVIMAIMVVMIMTVIMIMLNTIDSALSLALIMTLGLELSDQVVIHVLKWDWGAAKLVLFTELRELIRRDRLELSLSDLSIEVEVAVCEPLGETSNTTLAPLWEAIKEGVVSVNADRSDLLHIRADRDTWDPIDLAGAEAGLGAHAEGEANLRRVIARVLFR
jgi:hypothetical protein